MSLLHDVDVEFGHIVVNSDRGVVYQDDGSPVDGKNPRPCFGCGASIKRGEQDPCIANLPGVFAACCGHGRACTPRGSHSGYAAFEDGRVMRFPGTVGGDLVRKATEAVLAGLDLPAGFAFDEGRMWWQGLNEPQRQFVQSRMFDMLGHLVHDVTGGSGPSQAFKEGKAMWWDELNDEQKTAVQLRMPFALSQLADEAKRRVTDGHIL